MLLCICTIHVATELHVTTCKNIDSFFLRQINTRAVLKSDLIISYGSFDVD